MKPGSYRLAQPLSGAPSSSHFLISESVAARIRAGGSTKALPAPNRSIPGPPGHSRRMQLGWVAAGCVSSYCEPSHTLTHHQRSPSSIWIRSSAATRHQGCPLGRVRPGRVDESSTGLGLRRDLGEKKEESSLGARHVFAAVSSPGGGRFVPRGSRAGCRCSHGILCSGGLVGVYVLLRWRSLVAPLACQLILLRRRLTCSGRSRPRT
jgi:hypothetical protein